MLHFQKLFQLENIGKISFLCRTIQAMTDFSEAQRNLAAANECAETVQKRLEDSEPIAREISRLMQAVGGSLAARKSREDEMVRTLSMC